MTINQLILILVLAIPLWLAISGRIRLDVAALSIAVTLGVLQYLGVGVLGAAGDQAAVIKAVDGFSQPAIITLLGLFMITHMLEKTGVTRLITRRILTLGGESEKRVIALFCICAAALALFMNNITVAGLLLPSAINASHRTGIKASKLLMPIAFSTLLGGMATYLTTANIIVDDMLHAANPPQQSLNFFDFTPIGMIVLVLGKGFVILFSHQLLPERAPMTEQLRSTPTGSDLEDTYMLGERLWEAKVTPGSKFANQTLRETEIGHDFGVAVVAIWHRHRPIFSPVADQMIYPNDVLIMVGREDRIFQLGEAGLQIEPETSKKHISERGVSFVEMVLSPHSHAEGQTFKKLDFRKQYGFTVVALLRDGRSYRTDVADFVLKRGDAFLLVGDREKLKKLLVDSKFIIFDTDDSDQPLQPKRAAAAIAVTAGMIGLSVMGFPVYLAALIGALLLIFSGLLPMEEAYQAVEWQVIFIIAGMYTVSVAMVQTGLAALMGNTMLTIVAPLGSIGLAAGCFILSAVLTHIMGGQVTALVTAPIAISAAITLNTNPQAIAVATAIGCSAAFLSPLAHSVNILITAPGNYKQVDFLRLGIPMMLITFAGVMAGMIIFWRL